MQFVVYLFLLSTTFYLVSGECSMNKLTPQLKCKDLGRSTSPVGTKLRCSCKTNCFPVSMRCNRFGNWVSDSTTGNPCEPENILFVELGKNFPGLLALHTGHKVKFDCKKGWELRGLHVAMCEKGELHIDDLPTCVRKGRIPDFEGSGSGSGDSPRTDDDESEDDDYAGSGDDDDLLDRRRKTV